MEWVPLAVEAGEPQICRGAQEPRDPGRDASAGCVRGLSASRTSSQKLSLPVLLYLTGTRLYQSPFQTSKFAPPSPTAVATSGCSAPGLYVKQLPSPLPALAQSATTGLFPKTPMQSRHPSA